MARQALEHSGSLDGNRRRPHIRARPNPSRETMLDPLIKTHRRELLALAERKGLRNVRVFGSMARGDADETSDVDLLVTLPPRTSGFALAGLKLDFEAILGRQVDVLTEGSLHENFRNRVLSEAIPL